MIRHTNNLLFLLIISFFISCKEKENQDGDHIKTIESNTNSTDTNSNSDYTTWYCDSSTEPNKDYEDVRLYINNDSLKVIKSNELICEGEIVAEKQTFTNYFKSEKTGNEIREKLKKDYKLNVKNKLLVIMNAYGDITNKGCLFPYNELFIIDNHLFLYDNGYHCFVLNNKAKS